MLLSIEGEEACGKTTLAYTAPRKVVGFAFDMGVERAIRGAKYQELFADLKIQVKPYDITASAVPAWADHDITIYELPMPVQLDTIQIKGCQALWDYFIQLLVAAFKDDEVRTIVIDTMTVARRLKADAYLEALQVTKPERERLIQIEYGATNDAIRSIYTMAAGVKTNLVAVHHLTDERKETIDKNGAIVQALTGNRILEGLGATYRFVDVAVRNKVGKMKVDEVEQTGVVSTFTKCGYNLSQVGLPINNPTWDKLCRQIEDSLGGSMELERANGR